MRRPAAALLLLLGTPALAAAPPAGDKPPPYVDVYPFAAPIVQDGRLVNYVFVQLRLHGAPGGDGPAIKRLEPQIRDAIVRQAHRTPFVLPGSAVAVDGDRLSAFALAEGRRLAGSRAFASAEVRKQTPQRSRGLPAPRIPRP